VKTFWRFAAFFRGFQVGIVCTADLLFHKGNSVRVPLRNGENDKLRPGKMQFAINEQHLDHLRRKGLLPKRKNERVVYVVGGSVRTLQVLLCIASRKMLKRRWDVSNCKLQ
jgi:hypothetical protein